jgi:hypothetical protein
MSESFLVLFFKKEPLARARKASASFCKKKQKLSL